MALEYSVVCSSRNRSFSYHGSEWQKSVSPKNQPDPYRPYFWRSSDCHCRLRSGKSCGIVMLWKSCMHCLMSSSTPGLSFLLPSPSSPPPVRDWNSSLLRRLLGCCIHCTEEPFLEGRPRVRVLGWRDTDWRAPHPPTTTPTTGPSWGELASEWVSELEVESSFRDVPLSLPLSVSFSCLCSSQSCLGDRVRQEGPGRHTHRSAPFSFFTIDKTLLKPLLTQQFFAFRAN